MEVSVGSKRIFLSREFSSRKSNYEPNFMRHEPRIYTNYHFLESFSFLTEYYFDAKTKKALSLIACHPSIFRESGRFIREQMVGEKIHHCGTLNSKNHLLLSSDSFLFFHPASILIQTSTALTAHRSLVC